MSRPDLTVWYRYRRHGRVHPELQRAGGRGHGDVCRLHHRWRDDRLYQPDYRDREQLHGHRVWYRRRRIDARIGGQAGRRADAAGNSITLDPAVTDTAAIDTVHPSDTYSIPSSSYHTGNDSVKAGHANESYDIRDNVRVLQGWPDRRSSALAYAVSERGRRSPRSPAPTPTRRRERQ